MSHRVVSAPEFAERLRDAVAPLRGKVGVIKAARKTTAEVVMCVYNEPPMVRFWYERRRAKESIAK